MKKFEFIDTGAHSGAWNMEFDVQRAKDVDAHRAVPMVRVYRWDPWCISLGRHQSESDIDLARVQTDGFEIVRRPTGGRAILHAEELTYSVVMPSEGRGILDVYKIISEALVAGLQTLVPDIEMAKSQPNFQKLYKEAGSIPCFSSSARYEIEYHGKKLVGSAQRRIGSTVLQHGSILLGGAHLRLTEYLAVEDTIRDQLRQDMIGHTITLNEVARNKVPYELLHSCIREGFEKNWHIQFSN